MNELARVVSQFGLETLLQHIHTVIALVGSDGIVVSSNPACDGIKAMPPESSQFEDHLPPEEKSEFRRRLKLASENETSSRWIINLVTDGAGTQVGYDALILPAGDGLALLFAERIAVDPEVSRVIDTLNRRVKLFRIEFEQAKKLVLDKQTEVEAVIAQAEEISNIDALTFLPNRRQVIRRLQDEALRAQRYNSLFSVSVVDLDHFKSINDTYGHATGDDVLREVAMILRNNIRHPDLVGRYGGEEFLIILPNSPLEAASEQAARLCRQMRQSVIRVADQTIHITISIGSAQFRKDRDNWQTLLERADAAMYEAKKAGRDGWAASKI